MSPKMKVSRRVEARERLRARDGDNCFYCSTPMVFDDPNSPAAATIEHLINRTDRGGNKSGNLVLAGYACNSYVGDKTIVEKIKLHDRWPADAPICKGGYSA